MSMRIETYAARLLYEIYFLIMSKVVVLLLIFSSGKSQHLKTLIFDNFPWLSGENRGREKLVGNVFVQIVRERRF